MKQKTKNKLINYNLYFIILFFINIININAQLYTNKFENNATISPDSLFLNFEQPQLPNLFYKNYNVFDKPNYQKKYKIESFHFVCKFLVDTNGRVMQNNFKIYPLYNEENNLPTNHELWGFIIDSIKNASKNWVVKRLFWDLENNKNQDLKEYYIKSNNNELNSNLRPSYGNQKHLMILSIYPNVEDYCSHCRGEKFNYIYRIEVE